MTQDLIGDGGEASTVERDTVDEPVLPYERDVVRRAHVPRERPEQGGGVAREQLRNRRMRCLGCTRLRGGLQCDQLASRIAELLQQVGAYHPGLIVGRVVDQPGFERRGVGCGRWVGNGVLDELHADAQEYAIVACNS